MANSVKTAVSLRKSLFDQVDAIARQMNVSRSRLLALALEDFIRRYHNQQLLEEINQAYEDLPDPEEDSPLRGMRRQHRRLVEGEW